MTLTPSPDELVDTREAIQSCKRTKSDEEFLVVRLQVFCLLIGVLSLVAARKQKAASASLFDQRKIQKGEKKMRHGSDLVEMVSIEETAPLTDNDPLEIV